MKRTKTDALATLNVLSQRLKPFFPHLMAQQNQLEVVEQLNEIRESFFQLVAFFLEFYQIKQYLKDHLGQLSPQEQQFIYSLLEIKTNPKPPLEECILDAALYITHQYQLHKHIEPKTTIKEFANQCISFIKLAAYLAKNINLAGLLDGAEKKERIRVCHQQFFVKMLTTPTEFNPKQQWTDLKDFENYLDIKPPQTYNKEAIDFLEENQEHFRHIARLSYFSKDIKLFIKARNIFFRSAQGAMHFWSLNRSFIALEYDSEKAINLIKFFLKLECIEGEWQSYIPSTILAILAYYQLPDAEMSSVNTLEALAQDCAKILDTAYEAQILAQQQNIQEEEKIRDFGQYAFAAALTAPNLLLRLPPEKINNIKQIADLVKSVASTTPVSDREKFETQLFQELETKEGVYRRTTQTAKELLYPKEVSAVFLELQGFFPYLMAFNWSFTAIKELANIRNKVFSGIYSYFTLATFKQQLSARKHELTNEDNQYLRDLLNLPPSEISIQECLPDGALMILHRYGVAQIIEPADSVELLAEQSILWVRIACYIHRGITPLISSSKNKSDEQIAQERKYHYEYFLKLLKAPTLLNTPRAWENLSELEAYLNIESVKVKNLRSANAQEILDSIRSVFSYTPTRNYTDEKITKLKEITLLYLKNINSVFRLWQLKKEISLLIAQNRNFIDLVQSSLNLESIDNGNLQEYIPDTALAILMHYQVDAIKDSAQTINETAQLCISILNAAQQTQEYCNNANITEAQERQIFFIFLKYYDMPKTNEDVNILFAKIRYDDAENSLTYTPKMLLDATFILFDRHKFTDEECRQIFNVDFSKGEKLTGEHCRTVVAAQNAVSMCLDKLSKRSDKYKIYITLELKYPGLFEYFSNKYPFTDKVFEKLINKIIILDLIFAKKAREIDYFQDLEDPYLLHRAATSGALSAVQYAVQEAGYKPYTLNDSANQPVHVAAAKGRTEVVQYFVEQCGVDAVTVNGQSQSGLHLAVMGATEAQSQNEEECDYQGTMRYLVQKGLNVDTKDADQHTALHLAAAAGDSDTVAFLVYELKANIELTNSQGQTPLELARQNNHERCIHILIAAAQTQSLQAIKNTLQLAYLPDATQQLMMREIETAQLTPQHVNQAIQLLQMARHTIENHQAQLPHCVLHLASDHQIILERNRIAANPKLVLYYRALKSHLQQGFLAAMSVTSGFVDAGQDSADYAIKSIAMLAGRELPGMGILVGILQTIAQGANGFRKFEMLKKITFFAQDIEDILRVSESLARQITLAKEPIILTIDDQTQSNITSNQQESLFERAQNYWQNASDRLQEARKYLEHFQANIGRTPIEIKAIEDAKAILTYMLQCDEVPQAGQVVDFLLEFILGKNSNSSSVMTSHSNHIVSKQNDLNNVSSSSSAAAQDKAKIATLEAKIATMEVMLAKMQLLFGANGQTFSSNMDILSQHGQAMKERQSQIDTKLPGNVNFTDAVFYSFNTTQVLEKRMDALTDKVLDIDEQQRMQKVNQSYIKNDHSF